MRFQRIEFGSHIFIALYTSSIELPQHVLRLIAMNPLATKEEREIATLRDMRFKEFAFLVAFETFYNHKRTGRIQLGEQNGPSVPALVGDNSHRDAKTYVAQRPSCNITDPPQPKLATQESQK